MRSPAGPRIRRTYAFFRLSLRWEGAAERTGGGYASAHCGRAPHGVASFQPGDAPPSPIGTGEAVSHARRYHLALVFAAVLAVVGVVRLTGNADGRAGAAGRSSTPQSLTPAAFAGPEGDWWSNPVDAPGLQLNLGRLSLSPGEVASDSSLSGAVIYVESGTLAFVVQERDRLPWAPRRTSRQPGNP